jgi:segregation and condensation protein B
MSASPPEPPPTADTTPPRGEGDDKDTARQDPPPPAEEAVAFETLGPRLEAALLTSDRALTAGKLAEALGLSASQPVTDGIQRLNEAYEQTGRAFRIEQVAGGWQVLTLPEYADVLAALHKTKSQGRLSPAALETLSIVAYKQPVLRADLESIRGVACGETLRSLMERHLVKIVGRAEEIGRPMLYGTTKQFLEVFGLASLKDLPKVEELRGGGGSGS